MGTNTNQPGTVITPIIEKGIFSHQQTKQCEIYLRFI